MGLIKKIADHLGWRKRCLHKYVKSKLYSLRDSGKPVPHSDISKLQVLFFSSVGAASFDLIKALINKLSSWPNVKFLLVVYDDSDYSMLSSERVKVVKEKGYKLPLAKKYLKDQNFDYVMVWDDDLDVSNFEIEKYFQIVTSYALEMSQPSLSTNSYYSHPITLKQNNGLRLTDFVEIMAPVFSHQAWEKFSNLIEDTQNPWGWGYDEYAKSLCKYHRMGIIDETSVHHTRPIGSRELAKAGYDFVIDKFNKRGGSCCYYLSYRKIQKLKLNND